MRDETRNVWARGAGEAREVDFASHVQAIAYGRYVMRRIGQLLDACAVAGDLQPLRHQALLQIFGAPEPLPVSSVAERLSVAPAVASRLVRHLEERGLVERIRSATDKRVSSVIATPAGVELLDRIDRDVHQRVQQLYGSLSDEIRLGALVTYASYLGLDADPHLRALLAEHDMDVDVHGHS